MNAYTGFTTVNQGILSLTQPYLANTFSVAISTGAVDTMRSFYIDGVAQPGDLEGTPLTYAWAQTGGPRSWSRLTEPRYNPGASLRPAHVTRYDDAAGDGLA